MLVGGRDDDWVSTISSFVVPFKGDLSPSWGVHRDCVGVRGCVRGGYRDSLLETAQEAITIACTRVHRWAQHIWQEKQYLSVYIGSRIGHIWALHQLSACSHPPHRLLNSYFSICLLFWPIFWPSWPLIFLSAMFDQNTFYRSNPQRATNVPPMDDPRGVAMFVVIQFVVGLGARRLRRELLPKWKRQIQNKHGFRRVRGTKFQRNPEISGDWAVGVWEHTDSWLGTQMCPVLEPNTNVQRIAVTIFALSLVPLGAKYLEVLAQSPIGRPGTLHDFNNLQ